MKKLLKIILLFATANLLMYNHAVATDSIVTSGPKTSNIVDGEFCPDAIWYRLSVDGGQLYTNGKQVRTDGTDPAYLPSYFWCFVSIGDGLYQIYNYARGTKSPMSAAETFTTTPLFMDAASPNSSFVISENAEGFNLQLAGVIPPSCCHATSAGALQLLTDENSNSDPSARFTAQEVGSVHFTEIESLNLNTNKLSLTEGESYDLLVNYLPADAQLHDVFWRTSDTRVVAVDNSGHLKATGGGTADVTVFSVQNPDILATCNVNVDAHIRVNSITSKEKSLNLQVDDVYQLTYTLLPADAHNQKVRWQSSDSDIVSVDDDGFLYALAPGLSTITLTATDGSGVFATCRVCVNNHDGQCLYILTNDGKLTVLPTNYIKGGYKYNGNGNFEVMLISNDVLTFDDIKSVTNALPNGLELPSFESYKFNNDFNYQVFNTVGVTGTEAAKPEIRLSVGGIGKRLCASFKLPEGAKAWVDGVLQESKHTRIRFDKPVTYTIGYEGWQEVMLTNKENGEYSLQYLPFGNKSTVVVDWLTDHPLNAYDVPEVYITTKSGQRIMSKNDFVDATIEIRCGGVFPDLPLQDVSIKGRGNSSWSGGYGKESYRLKFEDKMGLFGLPKQKGWVLLANNQKGSMTCNAIEYKLASIMESDYPCHIIPIELYLNGNYEGSYTLTEKTGFSNSSIDLEDETYAAMLELDTYEETDHTPILHDDTYGMCFKIHKPEVYEDDYQGYIREGEIISDFNRLTANVKLGTPEKSADIMSLVNFLCTCDLSMHIELIHSKSVFLYTENVTDVEADSTLWHFGPIWDCDWSFGYDNKYEYFTDGQTEDFYDFLYYKGNNGQFWNDMRYLSPQVCNLYTERWKRFIADGSLDELIEFCDDYYNFASRSIAHNPSGFYALDDCDYAVITANAKDWFLQRANFITNSIEEKNRPTDNVEPHLFSPDGNSDTVIYNLSGMRMNSKKRLPSGIYLRKGKKFIVK